MLAVINATEARKKKKKMLQRQEKRNKAGK